MYESWLILPYLFRKGLIYMAAVARYGEQLQALATVCECMKGLINVSNQPSSGPIQGTEAQSPVKGVGEAAQV